MQSNSFTLLLAIWLVFQISACSVRSVPQDSSKIKSQVIKSEGQNQAQTLEDEKISTQKRLLVYNAYLDLVARQPDTLKASFFAIAEKYDGYVLKFSNDIAILKVKNEYLENSMQAIAQLGKLKRRQVVGEDITENYLDYKIRLENAEKIRARYLALLEKAQNIAEIMQVEKELARINTEIDLLKGKLNLWDNQISYATVQVNIQRKVQPSVLGYVFIGVYEGVKRLFVWN
jgi:hypothetical protein